MKVLAGDTPLNMSWQPL